MCRMAKLDRHIGTKQEAVDYALSYIGNVSRLWVDANPDMKQIYQRMIFPEGVPYNLVTKQFGTAKMSPLYRLATIKKDSANASESLLVVPRGFEPLLPG
jgi:hypothetical protein